MGAILAKKDIEAGMLLLPSFSSFHRFCIARLVDNLCGIPGFAKGIPKRTIHVPDV